MCRDLLVRERTMKLQQREDRPVHPQEAYRPPAASPNQGARASNLLVGTPGSALAAALGELLDADETARAALEAVWSPSHLRVRLLEACQEIACGKSWAKFRTGCWPLQSERPRLQGLSSSGGRI